MRKLLSAFKQQWDRRAGRIRGAVFKTKKRKYMALAGIILLYEIAVNVLQHRHLPLPGGRLLAKRRSFVLPPGTTRRLSSLRAF
jgi:hypothetical protein